MTWLEGPTRNDKPAGARLRELLERDEILRVPGSHNPFAALIAQREGFETLYISGGAVTTSLGLPDLGVMMLDELCFITRMVARATDLPLIVDGDVGYGGTLNAMRTVRELEQAGAGAVHIEDQLLPKKCGHLNDKRLVPAEEAAAKIAAAKKAARDLVIIARTDAAGVEGLDAAIKRANLYTEAGADVVFPDGLASEAEFRKFAQETTGYRMANMTEFGRTPHFSGQQFQDFGYDIVIWPATSMRVEGFALRDLYKHIRENDGTAGFEDRMMTRVESYEVIGYHDFEALDESVAQSVTPSFTGDDTSNSKRMAGE
ncbi:MAG: methylisocitrate lyase [Rhodospirillales bacterium]|nr:methylisocitrate lyase [Rhodospirillales bacterium]MBO6786301.1 methylisocitrate lyase [Rhodospirillales bacterium]